MRISTLSRISQMHKLKYVFDGLYMYIYLCFTRVWGARLQWSFASVHHLLLNALTYARFLNLLRSAMSATPDSFAVLLLTATHTQLFRPLLSAGLCCPLLAAYATSEHGLWHCRCRCGCLRRRRESSCGSNSWCLPTTATQLNLTQLELGFPSF